MIKNFLDQYRKRAVFSVFIRMLFIEASILSAALMITSILFIPYYLLLPTLIVPLFFIKIPNLKEIGRKIEAICPELAGRLIIGYELSIGRFERERYSQELIQAVIEDVEKILTRVHPPSLFRIPVLVRYSFFATLSLFTAFLIFFPEYLRYNLKPTLNIQIVPPGGRFYQDSLITFQISLDGPLIPHQGWLHYQSRSVLVRIEDGRGEASIKMVRDGEIYFTALRSRSSTYPVEIRLRTRLDSIITKVSPPGYTGLSQFKTKDRSIPIIKGSAISIQPFFTPDTIADFYYLSRYLRGRILRLRPDSDQVVKIQAGGVSDSIHLIVLEDLSPAVIVFAPGQDISLPRSMEVDLGIRISDDFRIRRVELGYQIRDRKVRIQIPFHPAPEGTLLYPWDLTQLGLLPGDTIAYQVFAYDDIQRGESRVFRIFFPTLAQIYEQVSAEERYLKEVVSVLSKEAEVTWREAEEVKEEFLRKREISWDELEKLRGMIMDKKKIGEELVRLRERWNKLLDEIADIRSVDPELIRMVEEISELLEEIIPSIETRIIDRLKEISRRDPEEAARRLDRLLEDQEALKRSLDRTIALLKRFEEEEFLRRISELATELRKKEEEIEGKIDKEREEAVDLSQELETGIRELKVRLWSPPEGLEEKLTGLQARFDSMDLEGLTAEQLKALKDGKTRRARELAGIIKEGLSQIESDLKGLYQELVAQRREEVKRRIERRIAQAINISKDQEELIRRQRFDYQDLIRRNIVCLGESIIEDQKLSIHIPPVVPLILAGAAQEADSLMLMYQTGYTRRRLTGVMPRLNQATNILISALEGLKKSGSPGGFDLFQQMLSSLAEKQEEISNALFQLLPVPSPAAMSKALKKKIREIARLQQSLRKTVEEYGRGSELARRIAREMKEIEEDLFNYRIDRQLIERQKEILTRLLDADRSIRRDRFDRKRRAEVGEEIVRKSPEAIITPNIDLLREKIMEELRKPYPKEYQHYIRRYYQIILGER